jgi:hypothetical protein
VDSHLADQELPTLSNYVSLILISFPPCLGLPSGSFLHLFHNHIYVFPTTVTLAGSHLSVSVAAHTFCLGRKQVLTAASTKLTVVSDVAPCSLLEIDRRFRSAYCLHHQGVGNDIPVGSHLQLCPGFCNTTDHKSRLSSGKLRC